MKVVTAQEMQEIDRITIQEFGIPGHVLMALAGRSVYDYISCKYPDSRKIAVVAGTGNNGGDGFVIAHFLKNNGCDVSIHIAGRMQKINDTSRIYLSLCEKEDIPIKELIEGSIAEVKLQQYDLLVDAIFGTGFSGTPKGLQAAAIELINSSGVPVLSIDLPSGLTSDGTAPEGPVVRADATITIGLPKISLVTYPGIEYAGEVVVADIGFPALLTNSDNLKNELVDAHCAEKWQLPRDTMDMNKSSRGHLLLIGGFPGMEGAIIMAAKAALKTGVGYITLMTDEQSRKTIAGIIPEMMTIGIKTDDVEPDSLRSQIISILSKRRYDAAVLGPGLGRTAGAGNVYSSVMECAFLSGLRRILIDGDGLFFLAQNLPETALDARIEHIITPHIMEASRITRKDIADINKNRYASAKSCAALTHAVTVLKGPSTITSDGISAYINTTGNPLLATAGTGDVLCGIIGALLLRDIPTVQAAVMGVYYHGKAADVFSYQNKNASMKATDLISML